MTGFVVSNSELVDAVNYVVTNFAASNALTVNPVSGQISTGLTSGQPFAYLYQYLNIRYANSATGSTDFSDSPTNRNWFGVRNTAQATPDGAAVPSNYVWYRAAGGFGADRTIWYETRGGRQITLVVANAAPAATYVESVANTAIDLDMITVSTGSVGNSVVTAQVFQRANVAPSTPTGGSYDFGNLVLTAPTGWANSVPGGVDDLYVSQNTFEGTTEVAAPVFAWTTPVILAESGNATPGERGFVPLAYVLTDATPLTANSATLTSWFEAPRTNSVAPIGTGLTPISGDTAVFTWITANATPNIVAQFDGAVWSNVAVGNVVNGSQTIAGTITADKLAANDIYALNIQSTGATIGNLSSSGFWLQASTGNARFAGNLSVGANATIGNNLSIANSATIGNNLTIGGNLTIAGLVTGSALNANTVGNSQILNLAVGTTKLADGAVSNVKIVANSITSDRIQANTITATNIAASTITGAKIAANTITGTNIAANTITATNIAAGTITADKLAVGAITANTVVSDSAVLNSFTSPGFWLNGSTGQGRFGSFLSIGDSLTVGNSATFGNNITIGRSLTVGNNAVIGGNVQIGANLAVTGLITSGALDANTVGTVTIVPNSVTKDAGVQYGSNGPTQDWFTDPINDSPFFTLTTTVSINPIVGQQFFIFAYVPISVVLTTSGATWNLDLGVRSVKNVDGIDTETSYSTYNFGNFTAAPTIFTFYAQILGVINTSNSSNTTTFRLEIQSRGGAFNVTRVRATPQRRRNLTVLGVNR